MKKGYLVKINDKIEFSIKTNTYSGICVFVFSRDKNKILYRIYSEEDRLVYFLRYSVKSSSWDAEIRDGFYYQPDYIKVNEERIFNT